MVGTKDRTTNWVIGKVVEAMDRAILQCFVIERTKPGARVYTDEHAGYRGMPNRSHEAIDHSVGEYDCQMAHTQSIQSFWSMLKRAHRCTFRKIWPKQLQRYVCEIVAKHNIRESDSLAQMHDTVARLVRRNLLHRDLIADNGFSSGSGA